MDFKRAKQYALNRLYNELSPDLYYHHVSHTLDVCKAITEIAKEEGVSEEELILLRTAGYFHDLGFVKQYLNNEPIAAKIAKEKLPELGYSERQIEIIEQLILATKVPQEPNNHLEKIICDADLDYLGRDDFYEISQSLLKEWQAYGLVESEEEFNYKQVSFFEAHHFFTETAIKNRKPLKDMHLAELKKTLIQ
ncbi:HD domain-containing protein [Marivirga sp.]|uniref:HD domain-containing protein n=1 Tax=Marivirga sp. TaxID=2018662 RepID=UPI0025D51EB0|nr:HD domain-containing protein [Marivirga sp.]